MAGRRFKTGGHASAEKLRHPLPPGTPEWITPELVEQTVAVWQPRYETPLSIEDAVAILVGSTRLLRLLMEETSVEVFRKPTNGTGK
jgi:hypothetical protein